MCIQVICCRTNSMVKLNLPKTVHKIFLALSLNTVMTLTFRCKETNNKYKLYVSTMKQLCKPAFLYSIGRQINS